VGSSVIAGRLGATTAHPARNTVTKSA